MATLMKRCGSNIPARAVTSLALPGRVHQPGNCVAAALMQQSGGACRYFFTNKAKKSEVTVCPESLDLSKLLTKSVWTPEELSQIEKVHEKPKDMVEKAAYASVSSLRYLFDVFSGYKLKNRLGTLSEKDWLIRICFLETVAGVPGMVAGMLRHLHSLRLMRRDYGWIHSLLSEAENERMHLLIALQLKQPGPIFRAAVIVGQCCFVSFYTIAYAVCPRYCHRLVGYLEEEAVKTYTHLLTDLDEGKLPEFAKMRAPRFARVYYNLPGDAPLRDVFECIRADEAAHRDTNHHLSRLGPNEPNTKVEHLRKAHFQNQNVNSGIVAAKYDEQLKELFKYYDADGDGVLVRDELSKCVAQSSLSNGPLCDEVVARMLARIDAKGSHGNLSLEDFSEIMQEDQSWSLRDVSPSRFTK